MRDNRPSGSEGGVESHISIPTPIYSTAVEQGFFKLRRSGMIGRDKPDDETCRLLTELACRGARVL
jgi:hypothetical protein